MFKESRIAVKKGKSFPRKSQDSGNITNTLKGVNGITSSLEAQNTTMLDKLTFTGNLSEEMKELKQKFTEQREALEQAKSESQ